MGDAQRVLVVGGGIAGLATARALVRGGLEVDVVERSAVRTHAGAGVYLPANAVRALSALGLGAEILDRACHVTRQRFLDIRGRVLLEVDLSAFWGSTGPCVALSHRDLHEVVGEGIPVRTGTTVTVLSEQGPRMLAVLDDGTSGEYDLVVGADGVRSSIRTAIGGSDPRFLSQASWRFLVEGNDETSAWTVLLGHGTAFLMVPLGHGRTYCYADVGDAAHAMSPNMAEGVGMALEDALVLAETVAGGRPLHEYEARRRPRVRFVLTQTHRRDRTRHLPRYVRDASLRLAGQRVFRSNYGALLAEP
jgi:2-polyprenyl-6-methoxyphenol hydroxylase-like FAD-dependent oxidoreductase